MGGGDGILRSEDTEGGVLRSEDTEGGGDGIWEYWMGGNTEIWGYCREEYWDLIILKGGVLRSEDTIGEGDLRILKGSTEIWWGFVFVFGSKPWNGWTNINFILFFFFVFSSSLFMELPIIDKKFPVLTTVLNFIQFWFFFCDSLQLYTYKFLFCQFF